MIILATILMTPIIWYLSAALSLVSGLSSSKPAAAVIGMFVVFWYYGFLLLIQSGI